MRISGIMVYYYVVCDVKLWYFSHHIQMEQDDINVLIGKELDEHSFNREDKHINIDNIISIDFIREHRTLYEVKKSRSIEQATILQVQYYLYYLKQRGVNDLSAKISYPMLKTTLDVTLNTEDEACMEEIVKSIETIVCANIPPDCKKKKICKQCAYCDLCFI